MDEFVRELKESAAGLHDGMGGHADFCAALMDKMSDLILAMANERKSLEAAAKSKIDALGKVITELEENAAAQALALKAAKAMQQAETERADANERDAGRYRKLRNGGDGCSVAVVTNPHEEFIDDGESCGGIRVNTYDEEIAGDKLDTAIDSM